MDIERATVHRNSVLDILSLLRKTNTPGALKLIKLPDVADDPVANEKMASAIEAKRMYFEAEGRRSQRIEDLRKGLN